MAEKGPNCIRNRNIQVSVGLRPNGSQIFIRQRDYMRVVSDVKIIIKQSKLVFGNRQIADKYADYNRDGNRQILRFSQKGDRQLKIPFRPVVRGVFTR